MTDITTTAQPGEIMEAVIAKGNLALLTAQERTQYYVQVCKSAGLNPFTKPFEYIILNGKLTLYALRGATDQLRQIHGISLEIVSQRVDGDLLVVHVKARDKSGRTDEDFGAVNIGGLKGEARANGMLKAITKAKRRVTLSISGLGFLDETEIDDIPAPEKLPVNVGVDLDSFATEPVEAPAATADERIAEAAASRGSIEFRDWWQVISRERRDALRPHLDRYQQMATAADADMAANEINEPGRAPPETTADGPQATSRRRGRPPGPSLLEPEAETEPQP